MHTAKRLILIVTLFSILSACRPAPAAAPAAWPGENWTTAAPEQQGLDSRDLARAFDRIETDQLNVRSLLIARHGVLVTEAYFHPYTAETRVRIQSITKSVIGALIGIAIERGFIRSVDQPLVDFFPGRSIANLDAGKRAITLRHLLAMTSGLDCDDGQGTTQAMLQSGDWLQFMLDLPMAEAPGKTFHYCSGNVHLLAAVLEKATGRPVRDFANTELFRPLGIADVPPSAWATDPAGLPDGSAGLYLTPQDIARFGWLYLNGGAWAGKQIVPAGWVKDSLTPYTDKGDGTRYGYLWTIYPDGGHAAALGMGGQQLHLFPNENLLVVFTAGLNAYARSAALDGLLDEYIRPAVHAAPLPENAEAVRQIAAHAAAAARPFRQVPPLPATARAISGKEYVFEVTPFGWDTLSMHFDENSDQAELRLSDMPPVPVGLDHLYRAAPLTPSGAVMMRGAWTDERTFVADYITVGELADFQARLVFDGEGVTLTYQDTIFGAPPLVAHGTAREAK